MKHFLFHLGDRGVLNGLSCFHCFSLFCCFGLSPWIAFGSRRCYLVPNLNPKWANALDFFQGEPLYISTMRARSDLCNFVTQLYLEISCCKSIEYLLRIYNVLHTGATRFDQFCAHGIALKFFHGLEHWANYLKIVWYLWHGSEIIQ